MSETVVIHELSQKHLVFPRRNDGVGLHLSRTHLGDRFQCSYMTNRLIDFSIAAASTSSSFGIFI